MNFVPRRSTTQNPHPILVCFFFFLDEGLGILRRSSTQISLEANLFGSISGDNWMYPDPNVPTYGKIQKRIPSENTTAKSNLGAHTYVRIVGVHKSLSLDWWGIPQLPRAAELTKAELGRTRASSRAFEQGKARNWFQSPRSSLKDSMGNSIEKGWKKAYVVLL